MLSRHPGLVVLAVPHPGRADRLHAVHQRAEPEPARQVPLDHVLVRGGVQVHEIHAGTDTGSDHLPVFVTFSVGK